MKSLPLSMSDKMLLNARNMAETIIGSIKAFSLLNLPKHRSPINVFLHVLAGGYRLPAEPIKPNIAFYSPDPPAIIL